jgi:alpha-galactosidase
VKEGIACYKSIRQEIKTALPRFPLGLIGFDAPWAATALDCGEHWYLSVWRKDGENDTQEIPIVVPEGKSVKIEYIYPKGLPVEYMYDEEKQVLRVTLEERRRARVFKVVFD